MNIIQFSKPENFEEKYINISNKLQSVIMDIILTHDIDVVFDPTFNGYEFLFMTNPDLMYNIEKQVPYLEVFRYSMYLFYEGLERKIIEVTVDPYNNDKAFTDYLSTIISLNSYRKKYLIDKKLMEECNKDLSHFINKLKSNKH